MAVNLAKKYQKTLDQFFTLKSLTRVAFGAKFDFVGSQTASVYTVTTQPLGNYTRTGANRYGTPTELQNTVKDYTITRDRGFSTTIDKGNYIQSNLVQTVGNYMQAQMEEQVIPEFDTYALTVLLAAATAISHVPTPAALTKSNAYESFLKLTELLDDDKVPATGRVAFVIPSAYNFLKQDSSFIMATEQGQKMKINGLVGEIDGVKIIKVPTSYMPANTSIIITHPAANAFPEQIDDLKVDEEPQGISGTLIEGRFLYDAFVLESKRNACAAWKTA
jgi:N4-gp56 family major capsid protein